MVSSSLKQCRHVSALLAVFSLLVPFFNLQAQEGTYAPSPGKYTAAAWHGEWIDASRGRAIPVKIYYPAGDTIRCPVVIFSHGLGGSRENYRYLGTYWAAHGFISVHLQHAGSDEGLLAGARPLRKLRNMKKAAYDTSNFSLRPADVRFALDELFRLSTDGRFPLARRMELNRIAVAGHSFGAYTVLAVAGQAVGTDGRVRYYGPDPRITAGLAMSSNRALMKNLDDAYSRITIPIFHMTGTNDQLFRGNDPTDNGMVGSTTAEERRIPYDHTRNAPAYLLILKEGDHMVFSGRERKRGNGDRDDEYQRIVCIASTAYWDAVLRGDAAAKRWLEEGGFVSLLGDSGTFEMKNIPR